MHGLGRRHAPDPRDHGHLMRAALPLVVPPRPKSRVHRIYWKGDQGETPMCCGYAWHGLLRAKPLLQREPAPDVIYHEAQKVDEWPGEDYDGTSVRAGAKFLRAVGKLTAYSWAFDLETVLNWLAFKGPTVWGTNWYESMFTPDALGVVVPAGPIAGGHAYVNIGFDDRPGWLIYQQSWPLPWGKNGRFYIRYEDAARLMAEDGEVCTAVEAP